MTIDEKQVHALTVPEGQSIGFSPSVFKPINIVVNGFSIKDTVFDVLSPNMDANLAESLAKEITLAFADKLNIRQGD